MNPILAFIRAGLPQLLAVLLLCAALFVILIAAIEHLRRAD